MVKSVYKGGWWLDEYCKCGCRIRTDGLDKWCSSIHCSYNVDIRRKPEIIPAKKVIVLQKKPIVLLKRKK
jgi:hypothetical protein